MRGSGQLRLAAGIVFLGLCLLSRVRGADKPLSEYRFKDYLGRNWTREKVVFPLNAEDVKRLREGFSLFDSDGKEALFQIGQKNDEISFLVDLPAFKEKIYKFKAQQPSLKTDLKVSENDRFLELSNSKTGVRLRRQLSSREAPLLAWRLPSGKWVGDSILNSKTAVKSYSLDVIEKGPVFCLAESKVEFANGGTWRFSVELQAFEPLVKVSERFKCPNDTGTYALVFNKNFGPDQILYRSGSQVKTKGNNIWMGQLLVDNFKPVPKKRLYALEAWLHWQTGKAKGTHFSLMNKKGDDLVFLGTCSQLKWSDPKIPYKNRASFVNALHFDAQKELILPFQLKTGEREYILGVLSKVELFSDLAGKDVSFKEKKDELAEVEGGDDSAFTLKGMDAEKKKFMHRALKMDNPLQKVPKKKHSLATLDQKYQIKHSDFPLNKVKDYVLEWEVKKRAHPSLLVSKKQLDAFLKDFKYTEKQLKAMRRRQAGVYWLDDFIPLYLASKDEALEKKLVDLTRNAIAGVVRNQLQLSGSNVSVGVAPHHHGGIGAIVNAVDAIYDSDQFSAAERKRLLGQLAFLGYLFNDPAYWDPRRGFGAMFINMHTTVHTLQSVIAGILPDHPKSKEWMNNGLSYMKHQHIDKWQDKNGKWIGTHVESPHYNMGAYDNLLAVLLMAHNTGKNELLYHDIMKQMGRWIAKSSTPRDERFMNRRHLPPIANTYKFEPSGIFGTVASIYQDKDPVFAAEMQWMQEEQGNCLQPGVGGFFGAFCGYRPILRNDNLPKKVPNYQSEWFNEAGAVLRSSYATDNEMMLYLIAGNGAVPQRHYDRDQGAVTIWGKGSIISDDFGYCGCAPEADQSMISSPSARGIMRIEELVTGKWLDLVYGTKGTWQRQVVLVKNGGNASLPEYFVIHDSFPKPSPATWRMWLSGKPVKVHGSTMLTVGKKKAKIENNELDDLLGDDEDDGMGELLDDKNKPKKKKEGKSILVGTNDILINGFNGVQTDIVFARLPEDATLKTERKTEAPAGMNGSGRYLGKNPTTQIGAIIDSKKFGSLLTLVYPRFAGKEKTPTVTSIADNRGVKIKHRNGTDYIFLSEKPIRFEEGNVSFNGKVGLIRVVGGKAVSDIPQLKN